MTIIIFGNPFALPPLFIVLILYYFSAARVKRFREIYTHASNTAFYSHFNMVVRAKPFTPGQDAKKEAKTRAPQAQTLAGRVIFFL